jgi:diguanylate cyclase (GGDEF)-like protein
MEQILNGISRRLEVLDRRILFCIALLLLLVIGYLDYLTGYEYSVAVLYLIPVTLAGWFTNRLSALILSVLSAVSWYVANNLAGLSYPQPQVGYWNAAIWLAILVIFSLVLSAAKKIVSREKESASIDAITDLMTSRAFQPVAGAELLRARRYKRPFTMATIDIDRFNQANRRLGRVSADLILKTVADTLRTRLRNTDLIARVGGDEFVALLPETNYSSGSVVISKLQTHLLKAMERHHWEITFSICAVTYYRYETSLREVFQETDKLMQDVKARGGNAIRFETIE